MIGPNAQAAKQLLRDDTLGTGSAALRALFARVGSGAAVHFGLDVPFAKREQAGLC